MDTRIVANVYTGYLKLRALRAVAADPADCRLSRIIHDSNKVSLATGKVRAAATP